MWIAVGTVVAIGAIIGLCGSLRVRHRRQMRALHRDTTAATSDPT